MEWKNSYLDMTLVPLGLLFSLLYHGWLCHKVKSQPQRTVIGIDSAGRCLWVSAMMKDNDKKNILVVQTLRNAIMGESLMATTSILLSCGLAAMISSTYSVKQPLDDSTLGAQGEFSIAIKYVTLLWFFLFAFVCYSLSIKCLNQVIFLTNIPPNDAFPVTPEYICEVLNRGFALNVVGNRLFYAALPLLLWIFGPILVFLSSVIIVLVLFKLDMVYGEEKSGVGARVENMEGEDYMEV